MGYQALIQETKGFPLGTEWTLLERGCFISREVKAMLPEFPLPTLILILHSQSELELSL